MDLYKTLERNQKNRKIIGSSDYIFFLEHRNLLLTFPKYRKFLTNGAKIDDFEMIRANIIIQSLINKKRLDEAITFAYNDLNLKTENVQDYVLERMTDHPYLIYEGKKIFIPIFSLAINELYSRDFGKLLKAPYNTILDDYQSSTIDLFETYNFALYTSLFTKFIKIYQDKDILVVYHYDYQTLYFINDQGRLDAKLCLFDKYLKKINTTHISKRAQGLVKAYLSDNREVLYAELIKNEFISEKLINKIKTKEYRFHHRKETKNI